MKRDPLVFVATFLASVLLGAFSLRCSDEDCGCPPLQARPEPQGPLRLTSISFGSDPTYSLTREFQPELATVIVAADELVVEYQQGGVAHRARYEVLPSM
jgi:hypothetical protein